MFSREIKKMSTAVTALILLLQFCMYSCAGSCERYTERFPCINDCGCGLCGSVCMPSTQNGKPESGFHCPDDKTWTTNTPSLQCAIRDDAIAPILLAILSIIVACVIVVVLIGVLLLCGRICRYITRNMSRAHLFNNYVFDT